METQSPGMSGGGVVHTQTYRPHASHLSPTRRCLRRRELAAFFRGKRKLPRGVPSLAPNPRPHGAFLDPGRLLPGGPACSQPPGARPTSPFQGPFTWRLSHTHASLARCSSSRHFMPSSSSEACTKPPSPPPSRPPPAQTTPRHARTGLGSPRAEPRNGDAEICTSTQICVSMCGNLHSEQAAGSRGWGCRGREVPECALGKPGTQPAAVWAPV